MAQIIKHRRGSLESLSTVTGSLQKGEIVIASGSSNITASNGNAIAFIVPQDGQVQATNRIIRGTSAPNTFPANVYNGMLNGVPYYASSSTQLPTLFLLGSGENEAIDLVGNIQPFSASVATSINALSASIGSGTIGQSVNALNTFSSSTLVSLSALNSFSSSQLEKDSALATYTGSVENRLTEVGVVTASLFSSASAAKSTNDTQDGRLTNLELTSASVNTSIAALNSSSASQQASIDALNSYTSSNTSTNALNAFTASAATRFTEIGVVSGSLISSASAANTSIANLNSFSSSQLTQNSNLATITGSLISTASNHAGRIDDLELFQSDVETAISVSGSNVTINGNFTVSGTQTIVDSTTVQIGDNIIELNGSGAANGGIYVKDATAPNTATGSIIWDTTNDQWKAGVKGAESKVLLAGGDSVVSGSSQITISDTTGYGDFSGSVSASIAAVVANVGSGVGVSISNLNSFSSSALTRLDNLELTGSDHESRIGTAEGDISTINGTLSDISTAQGVQDARLSSLETTSASVNISVSALNSSTASQQTQLDGLSDKTGSYATTGSNVFVGTQTISSSLNVSGSTNFNGAVAVNDSNVNLTNSSSLNLTAGSSIYVNGDGVISGSIVGIGNVTAFSTSVDSRLDTLESAVGAGSNIDIRLDNLESTSASLNISVAELNTFSASANTRFTEIGVVSGSLFASASTAKSTNDTQDGRLSNLETTSASVNTSVSNLNTKSASVDVSIANINSFTSSFGTTFSSSVDSRLDTLEGTGTIQGVGTGNDVTFAKVTTTGDVVVGGDLVVQGNTVTLNTATLVVEDKLITLASGSTSSATADGAGIEVAGANANFVYQHSTTAFTSSVAVIAPAVTASLNVPSGGDNSKRLAFRDTNDNINFVTAPTTAGDLLQYNGTDFVMSNTIDGGSF